MTPPKPHEVHKLVSDLLAREELEQAFQACAAWMEPLDDSFLRFNYLCLAVRLGRPQAALDWLEDSLDTDHWLSAWFLRRSPHLEPLQGYPGYQQCLQVLAEKEQAYWRLGRMAPITLAPPDVHPPYPLLVGLHGNGFNTLDAAQQWSCAPQQGWLATFPLRLTSYRADSIGGTTTTRISRRSWLMSNRSAANSPLHKIGSCGAGSRKAARSRW